MRGSVVRMFTAAFVDIVCLYNGCVLYVCTYVRM